MKIKKIKKMKKFLLQKFSFKKSKIFKERSKLTIKI
jgi:hypothetical protein